MASIFMRFPGGCAKTLTLSYDDGVEQDARLIEIMKKNGLKGTFNLNSGAYAPEGYTWPEGKVHRRMSRNAAISLYKGSGMEVAVHGLTHPFLEQLPPNLCTYEVLQDRINLEQDYECIVRGMAYPYGTYNDDVVASLRQCGIVYARTTESTEKFRIPAEWLKLPATCHHNNPALMELARKFVEAPGRQAPMMFYLWGHSYEFESDNNWNVIEDFAEYIGNRDDIWYATNIEIYDYIHAFQQLVFSMDGERAYNPTNTTLYFKVSGKGECRVEPGQVCIISNLNKG